MTKHRANYRSLLHLALCVAVVGCGSSDSLDSTKAYAAGGDDGKSTASYVHTCKKKDDGVWNFGEAPTACDAASFGDVTKAKQLYSSLILDRRNLTEDERKEYVTNLHAVIRDMVAVYLRRRQPNITQASIDAWTRAILSVGTQETFLSHYRIGLDGGMKLMTGDNVNSHGIMQIHQGFHASRDRDNSFDLVGNLLYGIELFYANYQTAVNASCVRGQKAANRWTSGIRSAYGIYNGGAAAICRWTKPRVRWSENDKGYFAKYKGTPWTDFVVNAAQKSPINVTCMMNGDENCAVARPSSQPQANRMLILPDGRECVMKGAKELSCVADIRMFSCLGKIAATANMSQPIKLSDKPAGFRIHTASHRDELCKVTIAGLVAVGDSIQLQTEINVRDRVGGAVIGKAAPGSLYQVLDYEITGNSIERYYRIQFSDNKVGYVFGGNQKDHPKWIKQATTRAERLVIPIAGMSVEIIAPNGVALRAQPSEQSAVTQRLEKGARVKLSGLSVRQTSNELYYQIVRDGEVQYFYAGRTYPEVTVAKWLKVIK